MIATPSIVHSDAQDTAVIRLTLAASDMPTHVGPAAQELIAAITAQGAGPAGPMYSYHLRRPSDTFDFELGFPVSKPVAATGRVQPGQLPATRVARTVYTGGYEGLGGGWGEFMQWIDGNGLRGAETLWERYVRGPESGGDPAQWQTELNRPLLDAG